MQATGTAEAGQGQLARIHPALHRHHPQRTRHMLIGDINNALRRRLAGQAQRLRHPGHGLLRGVNVQCHAAAEEGLRSQPPQHHIGIGHRGLPPTATITGRTGVGAGRFRPHLQQPAGIDPGNGSAAGADGMHVHHGHADRIVADAALGGQR
jgi:hypothetical protein